MLQEREFVNSSENIYKIGKTKRSINERLGGYPKNSKLIISRNINKYSDIIEIIIKKIFSIKYLNRKDIGSEYFEGNVNKMTKLLNNIVDKPSEYITEYKLVDTLSNTMYKCILPALINNSPKNIIDDFDDNTENDDELPSIFNSNNKVNFNQFFELENKKNITVNDIIKLMKKTCALIINGGNMFFITKTFDVNDNIIYNKIRNIGSFKLIEFNIDNESITLETIIKNNKHLILYDSINNIPCDSLNEFMQIINKKIFNIFSLSNDSPITNFLKNNTIKTLNSSDCVRSKKIFDIYIDKTNDTSINLKKFRDLMIENGYNYVKKSEGMVFSGIKLIK